MAFSVSPHAGVYERVSTGAVSVHLMLCFDGSCVLSVFPTAGCFWSRPASKGDRRRCVPSLRRCPTPFTTARNGKTGLVSLSLSNCCLSLCVLMRLCLSVTALPFTKNPDQHPTFRLYYSKEWLDTFQITLHNFFSTLFTSIHIPLPLSMHFPYSLPYLICDLVTCFHTC